MKISVVTVTYGSRWHLLSQVLNAIKDNDLIVDIIVVYGIYDMDMGVESEFRDD